MKKLIAFALALLMLLASVACAESAQVMTYSAPYLQLTTNGKPRDVDLSSLSLRLASGWPEGIPTVQAELMKKGRVAERGLVQYIDGKLYVQADGLNKTYVADLSQYGPQARSVADRLFEGLDTLLDFKLPAFEGVQIPMVDMTVYAPLMGVLPTTDAKGRKVANVEVPYFMVKQLLTMVSQYRDSVPAAAQAYAGPLFGILDGMLQSDSGFSLKGRIATADKSSVASLDIYDVIAGVASDTPGANVKLTSKKNALQLTVDMLQGGSAVNAVTLSLKSRPKKSALSFSLDVMSLFLIDGELSRQDGAQVISLRLSAMGRRLSASANYGAAGNMDFVDLTLDVPGQVELSASLRASDDGNGGKAGASAVNGQVYGDSAVGLNLTGNVAEGFGDVEFYSVRNTANAVDLLHMTDEQSKQLTSELNRLVNRFLSRSKIG